MKKKISSKKENNNFYVLVNNFFSKIEDSLDLHDQIDFDYEIQDYVITITFENKSLIIINKQEPLKQIWLATKVNGHHFNYKNNEWICNRSNKNFWEIFENACSIQSNNDFIFCKK